MKRQSHIKISPVGLCTKLWLVPVPFHTRRSPYFLFQIFGWKFELITAGWRA